MKKNKILWVDDEIDLLKPYIIFLEEKDYAVTPVNNGYDALEIMEKESFDVVLLDENMPGITGLEVLVQMKEVQPMLPVVMITKSEEEGVMDEAIGGQIADYLIKPVNPSQILMSLKRLMESKRLISEKTMMNYQQQFSQLGMKINDCQTFEEWVHVYKKLVYWDLKLCDAEVKEMNEVLSLQSVEANKMFSRFVKSNYIDWVKNRDEDTPIMSANIFAEKLFPMVNKGERCVVFLLDNLRFDQWRDIYTNILSDYYKLEDETIFTSILPTATHYARNAMFAGLMPRDIGDIMPEFWVNDDEDEGKNLFEDKLLQRQVERLAPGKNLLYKKILNVKGEASMHENLEQLKDYDISVLVYNFIDILSHSRTENKTLRELARDEKGYRDLVRSWFGNSLLLETIKELSRQKIKIVITTDHGCIKVGKYQVVQGLRETNTNLRYKQGKNLKYDPKKVFAVTEPEDAKLPQVGVSAKYLFALENDFLAYPNNMNHYVGYYRNTFQHGGVSMEEMLVPFAILEPR